MSYKSYSSTRKRSNWLIKQGKHVGWGRLVINLTWLRMNQKLEEKGNKWIGKINELPAAKTATFLDGYPIGSPRWSHLNDGKKLTARSPFKL